MAGGVPREDGKPSPEGIDVESGSHVWLKNPPGNDRDVWRPCRVETGSRSKKDTVSVVDVETGNKYQVPTTMLLHMDASSLQPPEHLDDMVKLGDLNEASILHSLRVRYSVDQIYTFIGPILISTNPFKELGIYERRTIERYRKGALSGWLVGEKPHIFGLTATAYEALCSSRTNQSIVISGESGAGKTEATKKALQYLATVAAPAAGGTGTAAAETGPEQVLLDSSPIIEAFGNAKTTRNNNSSRFGKYMEVHFDNHTCKISGGKITKYLLEKSRIVGQSAGERNYHIFAMIFHLDSTSKHELKIGGSADPGSFQYLNGGVTATGIDDGEQVSEIQRALEALGLPPVRHGGDAIGQRDIFVTVAATLWLGNISFQDQGRGGSGGADTDGSRVAQSGGAEAALDNAASLLCVDAEKLRSCCLTRVMQSREGRIPIPHDARKAADARNAIAKALYGKLFDWVIEAVDTAMQRGAGNSGGGSGGGANAKRRPGASAAASAQLSLGVLDIFGFEMFDVNRFEQLCINYANEKLQYHFNDHVFSLELQTYKKEGLKIKNVDFQNNGGCVEMIEHHRSGILRAIDDELSAPGDFQSKDLTLLSKLYQQHDGTPFFGPDLRKKKQAKPVGHGAGSAVARKGSDTVRDSFAIKHYAGEVAYTVDGFVQKNEDKIEDDVLQLLRSSVQPLVKALFTDEEPAESASNSGSRSTKPRTLGKEFKNSLQQLYDELEATNAHFVKCIKPNDAKANRFDDAFSLNQLNYLGLLEVVRIRKLGYPMRMRHKRFIGRYHCIARLPLNTDGTEVPRPRVGSAHEIKFWLGAVVDAAEADAEERGHDVKQGFQLGKSSVFMKDWLHAVLENLRALEQAHSRRVLGAWFLERCEVRRTLYEKRAKLEGRDPSLSPVKRRGGSSSPSRRSRSPRRSPLKPRPRSACSACCAWMCTHSLRRREAWKQLTAKQRRQVVALRRRRWQWLFGAMKLAVGALTVWWVGLILELTVALPLLLRLAAVAASVPVGYWLAAYVIRSKLLWQRRKQSNGNYFVIAPPMFVDPPLLLLVTLIVMHMSYRAAIAIDGGTFAYALEQWNQPLLRLAWLAVGPLLMGFAAVSLGVVALPNYVAQYSLLLEEQWEGELLQYTAYTLGSLLFAAVAISYWLWALYYNGELCVAGYFCTEATEHLSETHISEAAHWAVQEPPPSEHGSVLDNAADFEYTAPTTDLEQGGLYYSSIDSSQYTAAGHFSGAARDSFNTPDYSNVGSGEDVHDRQSIDTHVYD